MQQHNANPAAYVHKVLGKLPFRPMCGLIAYTNCIKGMWCSQGTTYAYEAASAASCTAF